MRMNGPCWSTAALGRGDADAALQLDAQGEHLMRCRGAAGRGFALRCSAETVQGFVAARFISTVLLLLSLLAGAAWLLY
jgi:hypothetical protein